MRNTISATIPAALNALPTDGFDAGNEITIDLQLEAIEPEPKTIGQTE